MQRGAPLVLRPPAAAPPLATPPVFYQALLKVLLFLIFLLKL